jgi:Calcineurin-like phosphoesterase
MTNRFPGPVTVVSFIFLLCACASPATPDISVSPPTSDISVSPATPDTKFSIAVIPDTQEEVVPPSETQFENRATWLANNKSVLDLRYALQVGDLVNWGHVDTDQFSKVSQEIATLEAAVPWAGAIGNHDTAAVCVGGSACPGEDTSKTLRNTAAYNEAFPVSRFKNLRGTFEPGKVDNAYHIFSAGGVEWLVLTLEMWPRPEVVEWGASVASSHPGHNVIVLTHAYLETDGSIDDSNGGYGATSPQYLFDNLIKVHRNIKIVVSGHFSQAASRTDVGVNGNKILSLMQTFHSHLNPVRLVEIDTSAGTVTSRVYVPSEDTTMHEYGTSTSGLDFAK